MRDAALDPVNLTVDRSGNLLVLVLLWAQRHSLQPSPGRAGAGADGDPGRRPVAARPDARLVLPVNWWNNGEFKDQLDPESYTFTTLAEMFARDMEMPKPREYVSPDGSVVLPASRVFQQGPPDHRGLALLGLARQPMASFKCKPGERVFVTNGSENRTYSGTGRARAARSLISSRSPTAAGKGVVTDMRRAGCSSRTARFSSMLQTARQIGQIDVPERPLQLVVGGADRQTLFILTHHALYGLALR